MRRQQLKNPNQILQQIRLVSEEEDQSREEQFIQFLDEEDQIKETQCQDSKFSKQSIIGVRNLKKKEEYLEEICRKESHSQWLIQKPSIEVSQSTKQQNKQIENLKEINQKLYDDNKSLMKECIRLKKLLENIQQMRTEGNNVYKFHLSMKQLQKNISHLQNMNENLCSEIKRINSQKLAFERKMKEEKNRLLQKIEEYERKQTFLTYSQKNSTIALSSSKSSDNTERDRMITNIRIVYENKIKILQEQLAQRQKEIRMMKNEQSRNEGYLRVNKF